MLVSEDEKRLTNIYLSQSNIKKQLVVIVSQRRRALVHHSLFRNWKVPSPVSKGYL
jgi:hypothetical protein